MNENKELNLDELDVVTGGKGNDIPKSIPANSYPVDRKKLDQYVGQKVYMIQTMASNKGMYGAVISANNKKVKINQTHLLNIFWSKINPKIYEYNISAYKFYQSSSEPNTK